MAQRIQRRRSAGWRLPENAIVVTRPTKWGNPFVVGDTICIPQDGGTEWLEVEVDPDLAVALYRSWIHQPAQEALMREACSHLRGQDLACWCADAPCHADVLLEIVNA